MATQPKKMNIIKWKACSSGELHAFLNFGRTHYYGYLCVIMINICTSFVSVRIRKSRLLKEAVEVIVTLHGMTRTKERTLGVDGIVIACAYK